MYGLSPETDLSPLNGCTLTFVGFGQYQLQLAFSGAENCTISIEGDYRVTRPGRESRTFTDAVDGASTVLPLLGTAVTVAEVPSDGMVRVRFEDGSTIDVIDSETHHESYQVNLGGRVFVV